MKIILILGIMLSGLGYATELDLRGAKMLEYCAQDERESCVDAVGYFLDKKEIEPVIVASDYLCMNKNFEIKNSTFLYCYIAGTLYYTENKDQKLASSRLKVSCAAEKYAADSMVKEAFASSCVLVAALDNNPVKFKSELSRVEAACSAAFCFESLAMAAAIMKDEASAIEFLREGIKRGTDIKEARRVFARFTFTKNNQEYLSLID